MCKSCDTFVVLPSSTTSKQMIFGKNSDRPNGEVQEIVFVSKQNFDPNSKQKVFYPWLSLDFGLTRFCLLVSQCTYIEIDSVPETYSTILSKPAWMWGAEMGSNEHGVCIGNEAIWHKLFSNDEARNPKLLGMDLVRLGLERAKTASDAINVITELLEKYGQGGVCSDTDKDLLYSNGFLIVDAYEAWVLETVGSEWAAEKVETPYRNISNCLSIGTKIDKMSAGLKETAQKNGLWDGTEPFDFTKVYTDPLKDQRDRLEEGKKLLESFTKGTRAVGVDKLVK